MANTETFDMVGFVMAYEAGELDEDEIVVGFQHLIDTGHAWTLQGSYGRAAQAMIDAGYCTDPRPPRPAKPELVGTRCECGAPYDPDFGGYACAR
jgi:hypothetical protein